jgi:hypothetical protein
VETCHLEFWRELDVFHMTIPYLARQLLCLDKGSLTN